MKRPKKTKNLLRVRQRKIFARRSWTAVKILLILVLFAGAVWGIDYFYNSNYFKIKTINVQGNTHYDEGYIEGLMGGLKGINIFEADKKKTEDILIESLVWVKNVEFRKIFPDRIEVLLEERKPSIIILYRSNRYLIDAEGMVLEDLGKNIPEEYEGLLEVSGAINYSVEPGNIVAKKNMLSCADIYISFDDGLKAIIKEAGIRDNISGDIFFKTTGNKEIVFGDSSQIIKKIEVLKLLLKEDPDYNIIDLRSPDNPVVKY